MKTTTTEVSKVTNPEHSEVSAESQFLAVTKDLEDRTEAETLSTIPGLGLKVPTCYQLIGETLYFLDAMGTCLGVCDPEQHDIAFLSGRTSSYGRASLKLVQIGQYDASLVLTRSIGEIANLLTLFAIDRDALTKWRTDEGNFSPVKVRIRLEKSFESRLTLGIDESTYKLLSGRMVHIDRDQSVPNVFNPMGVPTTGGYFQEGGLVVCLNELSKALAYSCWASGMLLGAEIELHVRAKRKGLELLENVGSIHLNEYENYLRAMNSVPEARSLLAATAQEIKTSQRQFQSSWREKENHEEFGVPSQ